MILWLHCKHTHGYVSSGGVTLQPRSEATIANILAAAATLFTARNYAEVTMDQIADAGQVTKGALYHHFSSKEELYLELIHSDLAEKRRLFADAVADGGSCRDRLERLTHAFLILPREKRELIKLVRRDINILLEPARSDLVRAYQRALPEIVEAVLRDAIDAGEIAPGDPRLLSWHFVATVEVTLGRYAEGLLANVDEWVACVMNLFFYGACARQEASQS